MSLNRCHGNRILNVINLCQPRGMHIFLESKDKEANIISVVQGRKVKKSGAIITKNPVIQRAISWVEKTK